MAKTMVVSLRDALDRERFYETLDPNGRRGPTWKL